MVTDTKTLRDILEKATQPYRLGAELSAVTIGDSQYILRHDMPAEDELDGSFEKINCGVMGVGVNHTQAEIHRKEFARIAAENFLVSGWIAEGISAKQFAAHSGEKFLVGTCLVAALGAYFGMWRIVLLADFFSPETLDLLTEETLLLMGAEERFTPEEVRVALTLEHGFYFANVKVPA